MGAPAGHTGHGKQRGVQLGGDIQHPVNKAGVKVHVGGNALIDVALLRDDLRRQPLHGAVQGKLLVQAFFAAELLHAAAQDAGARVADGVDGVAHAVDQAGAVEPLFMQQALQVVPDGVLVAPVGQSGFHVLEHPRHLDVGAAVAGAFQAGQCGGHAAVGIGAAAGDHMGGEGGVVAAAVLRVEHQAQVQDMGLQRRVAGVGPQQREEIFRRGKLRLRCVDIQALALFIGIGLVAVHRQQRRDGQQVDALAHHVGQRDVVRGAVVAGHGQDTAGKRVHHVLAGRLHDHVPHKVGRQRAVHTELAVEIGQLLSVRQLAEHQQKRRFLKAEPPAGEKILHQRLDGVAAVIQLARAGHAPAVLLPAGHDLADLGQTRHNAHAVHVAQAPLDVIAGIIVRVDAAVGTAQGRQRVQLRCDTGKILHCCPSFFASFSSVRSPKNKNIHFQYNRDLRRNREQNVNIFADIQGVIFFRSGRAQKFFCKNSCFFRTGLL